MDDPTPSQAREAAQALVDSFVARSKSTNAIFDIDITNVGQGEAGIRFIEVSNHDRINLMSLVSALVGALDPLPMIADLKMSIYLNDPHNPIWEDVRIHIFNNVFECTYNNLPPLLENLAALLYQIRDEHPDGNPLQMDDSKVSLIQEIMSRHQAVQRHLPIARRL